MLSEILKMMGGLDILSLLCHVNIILCPLHVAGDTILQGAWCEIRFLRDFYLTTIHMMAVNPIQGGGAKTPSGPFFVKFLQE